MVEKRMEPVPREILADPKEKGTSKPLLCFPGFADFDKADDRLCKSVK